MDQATDSSVGDDIPELTGSRVTRCLRDAGHDVDVVGVEAVPIGTGQMAGSFRLALTFDGDPGGVPPVMVAKIADGPPEQRALSANSYRCEVDFYRNLAPRLAARLPQCWGAWRNEAGDDFLLLLEDLAPWTPGDQIVGCDAHRAVVAVANLAGVHGPVWGDPALREILEPLSDEAVEGTDTVFGLLTELFLSQHGDQLSSKARLVCERFAPLASTFLVEQRSKAGVVHGDYRLDNPVAVIDWQTVGLGLAARDLAFFVATSLPTGLRREAEDDLIAGYHRALLGYGVNGYDLATCRAEYTFGLFQTPLVVMFGSAIAQSSERGTEMFRVMIERGAAAMVDNGTLDLV